jgi:hypothetical protein
VLLLAWFLCSVTLAAQKPPTSASEYELKLAFIYNFLKYVEWPGPPTAPLIVCVAGQNPFGQAFSDTMRDQVNGRPLEAREILEPDESCNVVFVPRTASRAYARAARGKPVLTIGETEDFLTDGGIIRFVEQGSKLRFEIDNDAAAKAKLYISPSLLRLRHNASSPRAK